MSRSCSLCLTLRMPSRSKFLSLSLWDLCSPILYPPLLFIMTLSSPLLPPSSSALLLIQPLCSSPLPYLPFPLLSFTLSNTLFLSLTFLTSLSFCLNRNGIECPSFRRGHSVHAPSLVTTDSHCSLQEEKLLLSCAGSKEGVQRLCPCREYHKGQVALCVSC